MKEVIVKSILSNIESQLNYMAELMVAHETDSRCEPCDVDSGIQFMQDLIFEKFELEIPKEMILKKLNKAFHQKMAEYILSHMN